MIVMSSVAIARGVDVRRAFGAVVVRVLVVLAGVWLAPGAVAQLPGTVVAWGWNNYGQCNVPSLPSGLRYESIAAGGGFGSGEHSLALRSDGAVVAWGNNGSGQCNVPTLPSGLRYESVAWGGYHSLALRSDGAVVAWGYN
jgi:alpha-tubulin suppressor-like RCC1 family protein